MAGEHAPTVSPHEQRPVSKEEALNKRLAQGEREAHELLAKALKDIEVAAFAESRRAWAELEEHMGVEIPSELSQEDSVFDKYMSGFERSHALEEYAAKTFEFFAKHGLRPREYTNKNFLDTEKTKDFSMIVELKRYLQFCSHGLSPTAAEQNSVENVFTLRPLEIFEEQEDDKLVRFMSQRFAQKGGNNLIEESTTVIIDSDGTVGGAISGLIIRNPATKQSLDIGKLIPNHVVLRPDSLASLVDEKDKPHDSRKSLEAYKGANEESGLFRFEFGENRDGVTAGFVNFGNLEDPEGVFVLFHEIAHAWQTVYQENSAASNFKEWFPLVESRLGAILVADRYLDTPDKQWAATQRLLTQLDQLGVEVKLIEDSASAVSHSLNVRGMTDKEGNTIRDSLAVRVKSKALEFLIADWVAEERDAWAGALRAVRALRKQGFDVAPGLKTPEDFRTVIHEALTTYQQYIDTRVAPSGPQKDFTDSTSYKEVS